MKKQSTISTLVFYAIIFVNCSLFSQNISLVFEGGSNTPIALKNASNNISIASNASPILSINLNVSNLPSGHHLNINPTSSITVKSGSPITQSGSAIVIFSGNIINQQISIVEQDASNSVVSGGVNLDFKLSNNGSNNGGANDISGTANNKTSFLPSIEQFIAQNFSTLSETPFGLIDPNEKNTIINLFFDQYGNSLLGAIPQGIANAQYRVHIIYPFNSNDPDKISYSVKQKTGSFSSALVFNNAGLIQTLTNNTNFHAGTTTPDAIGERVFLLGTATDDLTFDIVAASTSDDNKILKNVLETYTIKMSSVYHGSFDVGLLKTNLSNPTFTLVNDPTGAYNVVKKTDESPKGIVTIMASFYTSPIVLFEKYILKKKIPYYKLTGRNLLDDHKIYERFYPTIGVSINSKSFQNLFYGVNWEIARGLCLFYGWHYGKVNVFEMPNYIDGTTPVTQQQFDFYSNTKWKTSTAFGVKVDILIIKNLFQGFSQ
jgi:hypothetical protein